MGDQNRQAPRRLTERAAQVPGAQANLALVPTPTIARPAHGRLPLELTSFVGRAEALSELRQRLTTTRLLTLTGPPGVGKTRLALRIAAEERGHWPDGIWLIELAGLTDPHLVARTVADALAVLERPAVPMLTTLTESLGPLRLRIVLDNCEHLIAGAASVVAALLRNCPQVHVLATSREPLGLAGESIWPVPPLVVPPESGALPVELGQYEAVHLFVERASAVQPSFALTEQNAPAVVQICRRLDGMPLAIELAAARVQALTPREIADRLDNRFRLLTTGEREAEARQQTLRAAVDWSHDLLPVDERVLLRRLAVFAGGFSLAATEGICAGDGLDERSILDLLAHLVSRSLVVAEERDDRTRYRLLETLREYADVHLATAGERETVNGRHAAWYAAWAEAGEWQFWGQHQGAWLAELEAELPNIRQALAWCLGAAGSGATALRLVGAIWRLWDMSHHVSEGAVWIEQALTRDPTPSVARARALHELSHLRLLQGDYAGTRSPLMESQAMSRSVGNPFGEGFAVAGLALLAFTEGDLDTAETVAERGVAMAREVGEPACLYYNLAGRAAVARHQGRIGDAIAAWEEALTLVRAAGDTWFGWYVLAGLGHARLANGEVDRAATAFRAALEDTGRLWSTAAIAVGIEGLGAVAAARGDVQDDVRLCAAARSLLNRCGIHRPPFSERHIDRDMQAARQRLGETAFERAWAEGAALSIDAGVAAALAVARPGPARRPMPTRNPSAPVAAIQRPIDAGPPTDSRLHVLTPRELAVARLIADGLSNQQIATALVISPRTAATHVEHILNKLGLHRRTQIAAWISAHGLHEAPRDA